MNTMPCHKWNAKLTCEEAYKSHIYFDGYFHLHIKPYDITHLEAKCNLTHFHLFCIFKVPKLRISNTLITGISFNDLDFSTYSQFCPYSPQKTRTLIRPTQILHNLSFLKHWITMLYLFVLSHKIKVCAKYTYYTRYNIDNKTVIT